MIALTPRTVLGRRTALASAAAGTVFGTRAYVASPLTLDHDWLDRNLNRVRIGLVEGNTAIGAGIGTAAPGMGAAGFN